ncbi:hypothetical protein LJC59_02050 [Desulfovibrio sp. OttesenSCG-928-A18]|nr:hypothetical protein [Desulfovibrio sp. OttesenSCG-928-A18]
MLSKAGGTDATGADAAGEAAEEMRDELDALQDLYELMLAEDAALSGGKAPGGRSRSKGMSAPSPSGQAQDGQGGQAGEPQGLLRVISGPMALPGQSEPGRYACCEKGLALLLDARRIPSGAAVPAFWPAREVRDPKSGALVLSPRTEPEDRAELKKKRTPRRRKPGD